MLNLPNCSELKQIAKSQDARIYKEMNKNGQSNGKALKLILHYQSMDNQKWEHSKQCNQVHTEYSLISKLNHPNIIKSEQFIQNCQVKGQHFCAIELELADTDLFDQMSEIYPNLLGTKKIQKYFKQLAQALDYLHNQKNIAHNDIKLENIFLFKKNDQIKLADFGFANICQNKTIKSQKAQWINRCKSNLSPELLDLIQSDESQISNVIDEKKSDIFAFGITLFSAVMLRSPFESETASDKDTMYKYFFNNQHSKFWENSEIKNIIQYIEKEDSFFNKSQFIDLINKLLNVNPNQRISIREVLQHPFFL